MIINQRKEEQQEQELYDFKAHLARRATAC